MSANDKVAATFHPYRDAEEAARAELINPDCLNGKHANCWGDGWDEVKDEPAPCPCQCHPDVKP